ncbi:MAG: lipase family protein [Planctomycetes bacterium]|nr:lipase family protein [Planctomycetota bacterium]
MFGSAVLEVLIGLVVVFFVLSIVCSALSEAWASLSGSRGRILELGVRQLLGERTTEFFASPRIEPLCPPDRWVVLGNKMDKWLPRRPSYVPNATFAEVVLDLWAPRAESKNGQTLLHADAARMVRLGTQADLWTRAADGPALERQAAELIARAWSSVPADAPDRPAAAFAAVSKGIEQLFAATMDRATGWYRRRAQFASLLFAVPVVLATNADAISLTKALFRDPSLRAEMTAMGESLAKSDRQDDASIQRAREVLAGLAAKSELPLGWPDRRLRDSDEPAVAGRGNDAVERRDFDQAAKDPMKVFGWLISIVAASLGAPFWFQLLNKLVSLRGSGKAAATPAEAVVPAEVAAAGVATGSPAAPGVAASPVAAPASVPALDATYWDRLGQQPKKSAVEVAAGGKGAELGLVLDCARLSAAVYRDLGVAAQFAGHVGYLVDGTRTFDEKDTQVMVGTRGNDVVVCYRGTEPTKLEDWLTDAKFKLVPAQERKLGAGRVHGGFATALDLVAARVDKLVQSLVTKESRLVFTGHSLGAALASLHACRWAPQREVALVTFGSPRVGDGEFARQVDQLLGKGTSLRFVNGRDLVTRVPPRSLGFDHLGKVMYFDDRGALQQDGAEWFRWLADVLDAADDFKTAAGRTIQDHAMERYVARLEAAFAVVV